jgi:8-oxo-dGTP diphosphatase
VESEIKHFNIRVYALIFADARRVLLSDELQLNTRMSKFPGGGLQFGEGTLDCLHREMMEEFGQDVEILKHFYTTDFYQKALFYEDQQLISIYYVCRFLDAPKFTISSRPFDFETDANGNQSFRWVELSSLDIEKDLSFPVDQHVARLLIKEMEPKN